jgi:hypothetical protein
VQVTNIALQLVITNICKLIFVTFGRAGTHLVVVDDVDVAEVDKADEQRLNLLHWKPSFRSECGPTIEIYDATFLQPEHGSCPGWGANPGSFDFAYFLIPSLYRGATAASQLNPILGSGGILSSLSRKIG